jgi:hypothetical protein
MAPHGRWIGDDMGEMKVAPSPPPPSPSPVVGDACTTTAATAFSIERELATIAVHEPDRAYVLRQHLGALDAALTHTGPYRLRDDSRLAYRFVTGQMPGMSFTDVVYEMACTQFLCDRTPYHAMQQEYMRKLAYSLKAGTNATWTQVWHAVAEFGPEMLKLTLMAHANVRIA